MKIFKRYLPFIAGVITCAALWGVYTLFTPNLASAITSTTRLHVMQLGRYDSHLIMDRWPASGWNYAPGSDAVYQYFGDSRPTQYDELWVRYETASDVWATDFAGTYADSDGDGLYDLYTDKPTSMDTAGGKWCLFAMKGI